MLRNNRALTRWLVREVHGRNIPRKPPKKASALSNKPARNWRYRAWIRTLPSAVSGLTPCEAAHTGAHAIGQKSSDYNSIPLTPEEHREYHAIGREAFELRYSLDIAALVERLNSCWFQLWKLNE
jgi:hypothetical protein